MKVARFSSGAGPARTGIVVGNGIVALDTHIGAVFNEMPTLIEQWASVLPEIAHLEHHEPDIPLEHVRLHAPVPRPGKIMAIGLNYADHAAESGQEPPADQTWFTKPATAINAPYGDIELPSVSDQLDYEAEMVIVMGSGGRHISRARAAGSIFGFCVGNDVSVRDWQRRTSQVTIGKSFDTHAPIGPWIVTADEVNAAQLDISAYVNGVLRQHSNTRHLIFDVAAMIETLSTPMTLEPGDLIFTGTPAGVGARMNPPGYLTEGDVVRVHIDGLGAIENRVIREKRK